VSVKRGKGKGKIAPVHTTKAKRRINIALLIPKLNARWR
jgi:hypothetical protein